MPPDERDLEQAAARLGARAAARMDVDAVTDRVLARLRAAGPRRTAAPAGRWLAAAAAVVLVAGAAFVTLRAGPPDAVPVRAAGLTPGLDDLSTSELVIVLDSLTVPPEHGLFGGPTLYDLDVEQLETLLARMEG